MLQDIRDNSQGVVAKIIIGLIIAVFALFGVESIIGGFVSSPPVAEVNGEEITEAELQQATQSLLTSFGGSVEGLDQDLIEQIALNQLIEGALLRQRTAEANMNVSSDRIDQAIVETPQFQIGGQFDPDLAVRTMATQGFTVPMYRNSLSEQMRLGQLVNAFSNSNFVTDAELERVAELTRQTRDFRYVSIPMGTRTLDTPITEEEIQSYYDANQERFREDESVVLNYVLLDQASIADSIDVPEEELRARYEGEREAAQGATEKRVSHILFEVGGGQSEEQAMERAREARQRIEEGEDFAALAAELSDDTISGEDGGDIGFTDGTAFPEAIEEVLTSLEEEEVSEPVVSEFGVHLVKLTQDAENNFPSFEEARDRIERDVKSAEVELIYAERLEDLSNLAFETGDLETLSEELGLEVQQSPALTRSGGSGIFADPQVMEAAFSDSILLENNNSDAIEIGDTRAVVLHLNEFNESSILPLNEVRAEISVLLRAEKEREAVQELGNELLQVVESDADLESFLEEHSLSWIDLEEVARNANVANQQIIAEAFTMPAPEGGVERSAVTLSNGTFVLIELQEVAPGSLASLSEEEQRQLQSSMAADYGGSDFDAYLNTLRNNADIEARERTANF